MHAKKITNVMDMAIKTGAPFISINDSGGARIEEGIDALKGLEKYFPETLTLLSNTSNFRDNGSLCRRSSVFSSYYRLCIYG